MLRSAASKVMWVGRATVFMVGLAVIVGLVFGAASVALGANGGNFILGRNNVATALTKLTGNVNGSAMRVANTNAGTDDTALSLDVEAGEAPMSVDSSTKVRNLNADELDGLGVYDIGLQEWAVVRADGTLQRDSGDVAFSRRLQTGKYEVALDGLTPRTQCASVATTSEGNGGRIGVQDGVANDSVIVYTYTGSGTSVDLPFHLIMTCQ